MSFTSDKTAELWIFSNLAFSGVIWIFLRFSLSFFTFPFSFFIEAAGKQFSQFLSFFPNSQNSSPRNSSLFYPRTCHFAFHSLLISVEMVENSYIFAFRYPVLWTQYTSMLSQPFARVSFTLMSLDIAKPSAFLHFRGKLTINQW